MRHLRSLKITIEQWLADFCEGRAFAAQDRGDFDSDMKWRRWGAWFAGAGKAPWRY